MEDLRSGRLARETASDVRRASKRSADITPKVCRWSLSFPELRVFVTGGASGIGRGIVEAFRAIGVKVAFCDVDNRRGQLLAQKCGARFYPLDVTDCGALENAMLDLAAAWGDIDVVVNNAGIGNFKSLEDMDVDDWQRVVDTNLRPLFVTGRTLARIRNKSGLSGGSVVNISSTRHMQSEADTLAYSSSKGGVASATHSLMMSLARYGITVNCISPGWINVNEESLTESDKDQHPSKRVGNAADVASLVLYLAHPSHNFINGADIPVDGGMTHKMIYV